MAGIVTPALCQTCIVIELLASYPETMEEILDIVNESDEVVAQAPRSEIHQKNLLHRATHIILTNSKQQIFMQLRSMSKDTNPGRWDSSAAGHVDAGESYVDCASRELEEELGVTLSVSALTEIGRLSPSKANGFEFVRIYAAQTEDPITLEAGEIDDGKWVTQAELNQWIETRPNEFASSFLVIWETVRPWRECQ